MEYFFGGNVGQICDLPRKSETCATLSETLDHTQSFLRGASTRRGAIIEDKVQRAALFGSKVRGDYSQYSDVDILLIVTDDKWKYRQPVSVLLSDIALKYGVKLDVRVISEARWQWMANTQAGLYQNIMRDAVPIRFRKTAPAGA